jgi:methylamine dehydrogenase accessory protein MauD
MAITLIALVVLLMALVLVLCLLVVGTLRALAHVRWRMEQLEAVTPSRIGRSGIKPGTKAPDFSLPSTDSRNMSLSDFQGKTLFLVFIQPGCGPCKRLVPELHRLHERDDMHVVVVFNGPVEVAAVWSRQEGIRVPVLAQEKYGLSRQFEVFATPFAFVIDEHGIVRSKGIVSQREHVEFVLSAQHDEPMPKDSDNQSIQAEKSEALITKGNEP